MIDTKLLVKAVEETDQQMSIEFANAENIEEEQLALLHAIFRQLQMITFVLGGSFDVKEGKDA